MVQRCVDVIAGTDATVAIVPAGTANLLATNLGIPDDIEQAVDIGLSGHSRPIDLGRLNGERFAVMAGAGLDARMIGDADGSLKDRFGRLAYVWTGAKHLRAKPFRAKIKVDGARWYDGEASCILLGNVGKLFGGVEAFEDAQPDDGVLELGVVSAEGVKEWAGTVARAVVGTASKSPHAITTKVRSVRIKLDRKVPYEIDGGDRTKARKLRIDVEPEAVRICVPREQA
jgi:diacylglycerol kinase (ATP)